MFCEKILSVWWDPTTNSHGKADWTQRNGWQQWKTSGDMVGHAIYDIKLHIETSIYIENTHSNSNCNCNEI